MIVFLGGGLMFVGGFALLIAAATNSIPANWPFEPRHRDDDPVGYRRYMIGYVAVVGAGAILLLAGLVF